MTALASAYQRQVDKFNDDPTTFVLTFAISFFVASILVRKVRVSMEAKTPAVSSPPAPKMLRDYTPAEVAVHNKEGDLWLIIRDKDTNKRQVYDLTEYADEHPGGDAIYDHAGGDATEGFHGPQHPPTVHQLVKEYHIGYVPEEQ
jgi:cytochrome b involved in lipid metabolism